MHLLALALLLLVSFTSCSVPQRSCKLARFKDEATYQWGFKTKDGHVHIPAHYRMVSPFTSYCLADVWSQDGKWYRINQRGEVVLQAYVVDNGPDDYIEGLARFIEEGRIGFSNPQGKKIIPALFDHAEPFFKGVAVVSVGCKIVPIKGSEYHECRGGKWSVIDKKGRLLLPFTYDGTFTASDEKASLPQQKTGFLQGTQCYELQTLNPLTLAPCPCPPYLSAQQAAKEQG